ncbi:hypothetical protein [Pseudactinotalea sp. HY158]|uniref:hypothetical protein n=1 Tax=Pseudactinotalea sp. HY158 TaxID=2654547 RepID=UPI00129CBA74|nr:hypothetical protein [Pseudactinotalea sp. HY158]QGH69579.1 hypothetical protein GCE65_08670 [Pseudactinotalea sp. HY158]
MTEMLAALLGAIVGGVLSAWVGSRQTAKVLKHETELAAEERRESKLADELRRQSFAADQLLVALADFTTINGDENQRTASFARVPATADVHTGRKKRVSTLLQAGSSHAHALPPELHARWEALAWMVRFNQSEQGERTENLRQRDVSDLLNYVEYVRQSLCAVSGDGPMPANYAAPDVRRDGHRRWGFRPDAAHNEPDLTEWHLSTRLIGKVKHTTGETRWYGPNGLVEDIPQESSEAEPTGD